MSLLFQVILFIYFINTSRQTRQWIEVQVEKAGSFTLANEKGIPVTGMNSVVFTVKACTDAVIVVSDIASIANEKGRYFLAMIGKDKNTMTQVMDSCFTCNRTVITKGKFLDCNKFMPFWAMWGAGGEFKLGKGNVVGREGFLTLKGQLDNYMGNFIQLTSTGAETPVFRFARDSDLKFTVPNPDGSTVIKVNETEAVGLALLEVKIDSSTSDIDLEVKGQSSEHFKMDKRALRVNMSLDYESKTFYSLTIGNDAGNSVAITIEVLDENDESPIVDTFPVSITEEIAIGTLIGGFYSVSDRDRGDNLTWSLTGEHSDVFIASEEGMMIAKRIDRDEPDGIKEFNLTLTVTDLANHETSAILRINVTDKNDNSPVCDPDTHSRKISEGLTEDTEVLNLTSLCSDLDEDHIGELTYKILGDDWVTRAFAIRDHGSLVALAGGLDLENAEQTSDFRFYVLVQDNAGKPKSRKTYIAINVETTPSNEFPPEWQSSQANTKKEFEPLSVLITSPVGTTVAYLTAFDNDKGDTLAYSFYSVKKGGYVDGSKLFRLDTTNGGLSVSASLKGMESVIVGIQATDGDHKIQASLVVTAVNSSKGGNPIPLPVAPPISTGSHSSAVNHPAVSTGSGHSGQSTIGFDKRFYFIQTPSIQDHGKTLLSFSVHGVSGRHLVMVDLSASTFFSVKKSKTWNLVFSPRSLRNLPTLAPLIIKDKITKRVLAEAFVILKARDCQAASHLPQANKKESPKDVTPKHNDVKPHKNTLNNTSQGPTRVGHHSRYFRNQTRGCGVTISSTAKTLVIVSASEAVLLVGGIAFTVYSRLLSSKRTASVVPKGKENLPGDDGESKKEVAKSIRDAKKILE